MKKIIQLVVCSLMVSGVYAQKINEYKYIIVPKKFSILKDTNQYQLNTLTRMLFKDAGFTAIYDDVFPEDLQKNSCLGLKAELTEDSGMFSTKLKVTLQDCKKKLVFTSVEGKSRKKEYKKAHQEALRAAFKSIKALNYVYTPATTSESVVKTPVPPVKPATQNTENAVKLPVQHTEESIKPAVVTGAKVLYAQPVANGFQLVDSTPKVLYIIQKTSLEDFYIIKDGNGILYKKDGGWVAEYYNDTTLIQEIVTVKF